MEKSREEKLAEDLAQAVNTFGFNRKKFFEAFTKQHRYLQGEIFSDIVIAIIEGASEESYGTDARNEFVKTISKALVKDLP